MQAKAVALFVFALATSFGQTLFPSGLTRFAGIDTSTLTGDNGPAYNAVFDHAVGLARDAAGNFYITEATHIRKIDAHGTVTTIAQADVPSSPAPDGKGGLYFIETGRIIRRVAPDGTIATVAGNGNYPFNGEGVPALSAGMVPSALAVDAAGQLYFTDFSNARVRVIRADGNVYTVAGTGIAGYAGEGNPALQAQLDQPLSLAFDPAGNLYVADYLRVVKIDTRGILTRIAGDPAIAITSAIQNEVPAVHTLVTGGQVAADGAGNVYIASPNVRKITPDGIIHQYAGAEIPIPETSACGKALNAVLNVRAIVSDPAGTVYVLNDLNPAVSLLQQITSDGKIVTIGGDGPNRFSGDGGSASLATFAAPSALALDKTGRLYIADTGNNRIRAIDPNGTVRTIAGDGGPTYDQDPACMADSDNYLRAPRAMWLDAGGNLFIADTGKNRIRKLTPDGVAATVVDALDPPVAVAADAAGNLWIGDLSGRLLKLDTKGTLTPVANISVSGSLSFDKAGDLLIPTGPEVDRLTPAGALLPAAGTAEDDYPNNLSIQVLDAASAAVTDAAGSLYVADSAKGMIQRTSANCAITADGQGQLHAPKGLAMNAAGTLYIADSATGVIWMAPPTAAPATEAPTPFLALKRPVQSAAPSLVPVASPFPNPFGQNGPLPPEGLAPGELVRFNGACIGPPDTVVAAFDASGKLPTTLGGVSLLIGGSPVPLISVQAGSIVGVVPVEVPTSGTMQLVQLGWRGQGVSRFTALQPANPALFTANLQTSGAALAVNQDGTVNSAANPAPKGSTIALYGTGTGLTNPVLPDGAAAPVSPLAMTALPVTATITGVAAQVIWAGAAPGFAGLSQINVQIPSDLSLQGAVLINLKVGGTALNQNTVTIFVK
jgi:uncharacterized protein (TIGR03437 family)